MQASIRRTSVTPAREAADFTFAVPTFAWVYRGGPSEHDRPVVWFQYAETRSGEIPRQLLHFKALCRSALWCAAATAARPRHKRAVAEHSRFGDLDVPKCIASTATLRKVLGLEKSGLEAAPEKRNLIRFCPVDWKASGGFEFLGFELRRGADAGESRRSKASNTAPPRRASKSGDASSANTEGGTLRQAECR